MSLSNDLSTMPNSGGIGVKPDKRLGTRSTWLAARKRLGTPVMVAIVAGIVVYVAVASWTGAPFTWDAVVFFLVTGITLGSIYAISAAGLVVTYSTTGVFNFAQGSTGMFLTYIYWELTNQLGVPTLVALLLVVLVFAPLLGAAIDLVIMRRLRDAPMASQLVVTIGLMLFFIGVTTQLWNPNTTREIGTFFGTNGFHIAQTFVPWYRVVTVVTGLGLALALRLLLRHTRLGVAMRAVVDNRELAAHNGARPWVLSMSAWAIGTSMAALAGIFFSEELSSLVPNALTLLIVDCFAAAIIGRLRSLPMTYLGGMIIGFAIAVRAEFPCSGTDDGRLLAPLGRLFQPSFSSWPCCLFRRRNRGQEADP